MSNVTRWLAPILVALTAVAPAGAGAGLEGTWTLVEQHYGDGHTDLVDDETPLRLEIVREGAGLAALVRAGDRRSPAEPWPALAIAGERRTLDVDERSIDAPEGELVARYRLEPAPGDGLVLHVVERYRLTDGGDALVGTVSVDFVRDGAPRGGYVLTRRFERAP